MTNQAGIVPRWCGRIDKTLGDEKGISLTEVLISLFILSSVLFLLASSLLQFLHLTTFGNDRMLALADIQTAQLWLGRDAAEAATFSPGSGDIYGTFMWPDGDPQFQYSYDSIGRRIVRTRLEGGNPVASTTAARHIDQQSDAAFVLDSGGARVSVTITATSGDETTTSQIELYMRVH